MLPLEDYSTCTYPELVSTLRNLRASERKSLLESFDKTITQKGLENTPVELRFLFFSLFAEQYHSDLPLQSSSPAIKERLEILVEEKDVSPATILAAYLEDLINPEDQITKLNGLLKKGPKVLYVSPVKYPSGDQTKHSIGNRFAIFQHISELAEASYLERLGIEAKVFDLGLGQKYAHDLAKEIEAGTLLVSLRLNNPLNEADLDTLFFVYDCIQKLPENRRPLLAAGGVSAVNNRELLLERTPIDFIFRDYGTFEVVDMAFDLHNPKSFENLPNIYRRTQHGTKLTSIKEDSLSRYKTRLRVTFSSLDFSKLPFREYWKLNPSPESLHPENRYLARPTLNLATTHGDCKVGCEFCAYPDFTKSLFGVPPEDIVRVIDRFQSQYPEIGLVNFIDGDFVWNKLRAEEFLRLYALNLGRPKLFFQTTVYKADEEFLRLARKSGVDTILFGEETASPRILQGIGKLKSSSQYQKFDRAPYLAKEEGISTVRTTWILFYPSINSDEVLDTVERITNYINDGIHAVVSSFVLPRPGSRIWREKSYGKFINEEYALPDGQTFPLPKIILPEDRSVREVALASVRALDSDYREIVDVYYPNRDAPEQLEALVLFRRVLREYEQCGIGLERVAGILEKVEGGIQNYLPTRIAAHPLALTSTPDTLAIS